MTDYVIGLDFGTLSCRAVVVDAANGYKAGEAVSEYTHGVITGNLPDGTLISDEYALQDPQDYPEALSCAVKNALESAGVTPDAVKGIGLDFTSCTILPVDASFTPLCRDPRFAGNPHAYVKLWKHHGAVREAEELTAIFFDGQERGYPGTRVSPEQGFPKILETIRKAPDVYDSAFRFIEAGDWVNTLLTGTECHSAPFAGYKFLWKEGIGYPDRKLLKKAGTALSEAAGTKLSEMIRPLTEAAGRLSEKGARITGLPRGTPVAQAQIDAHAAIPGAGAVEDGDLVLSIGTSACHMLQASEYRKVPGIFGCMKDGAIPGLYTYEAGQSAVGDIFSWIVENTVPSYCEKAARERGIGIHEFLSEKAALLPPGGRGLVAVDWLNGCRTPLDRADLSGSLFGLRLSTKPEEIYRAFMEGAAFGSRRIVENYEENGVSVKKIFLSGGIAQKNPLFVQILADVIAKPLYVLKEKQCTALGSAVYAAAAAGIWPGIREAAAAMHSPVLCTVLPKENYDRIYQKYRKLSDMMLELKA